MNPLLLFLFLLLPPGMRAQTPGVATNLPPCCAKAAVEAAALPGDSLAQLESAWRDQAGTDFSFDEFDGGPRLIAMFFAQCTYACPRLVEDMRKAQRAVNKASGRAIPVALFSFDHVRDLPEKLTEYAAAKELPKDWRLFHGDADAVREVAAALGVSYRRDPATGDFGHSNRIVLLGPRGSPLASAEGLGADPAPLIKAAATLGTPSAGSPPAGSAEPPLGSP